MIIKTWEIDKSKERYEFNYTEDFSHIAKEINQIFNISEVAIEVKAERLADFYSVSGRVKAKLTLECSRCLSPYEYSLDNEFKEIFVPKDFEFNFDNEEEYSILDSSEIDIQFIVEEAVAMGIPYIPLCNETCKGLCISCGVNLNIETCSCINEKIDPRLADLANWVDKN